MANPALRRERVAKRWAVRYTGVADGEAREKDAMKLLKWALGGASVYVIYRYSIGRKAKGEDVFVTPEKAVRKIVGENAPARKRSTRKAAPAEGKRVAPVAAGKAVSEKPKRKRAPRKAPGKPASGE